MARVLYVSYDGLLEPLGESQVTAYMLRLARAFRITVLSYEKPRDLADAGAVARLRARLDAGGVDWVPLRYHKTPSLPATAWDVARGILVGLRLARARPIAIVHARGYVASLVAVALKMLARARFLFDMRGFWADEKREAGHWARASLAYRLAKRCERTFFERADAIVSLTEEGVKAFPLLGYRLPEQAPIEVIPTCADLAAFAPGPRDEALAARLGLQGSGPVLGCVGTLSNWYLRRETLSYLGVLARAIPGARVLFVTREPHDALRRDALAAGLAADAMVLTRADFRDMPAHVRLMDLGVFLIRPCFSKKGSAATKLAEFLGTGVPVVINDGVGDSGRIVRDHQVGVVLAETTGPAFEASRAEVRALLGDPALPTRCVTVARKLFDVDDGAARYAALYRRLGAAGRA